MRYLSTRGGVAAANGAQAILNGIAQDGGLYVPETVPLLSDAEKAAIARGSYADAAALVFRKFLPEFSDAQINACTAGAYTDTFDDARIAPLVPLDTGTALLELWHGPTAAFKDVALQALPRLMTASLEVSGLRKKIAVLTATSGDTGKAALAGFRDVAGTGVTVLYPKDGVSVMQKRQMLTQRGKNVAVLGVEGNFDDAQTAAKTVFGDEAFRARLMAKDCLLSSANSINWGRLLPQIVYYLRTALQAGGTVDFIVPTGNFGNILAAYYARRMGAPVGRLVCASNRNSVLTDFIRTGVYDSRRPFYRTLSPSMDILISSNLERLLFELSDRDAEPVKALMAELSKNGRYRADARMLSRIQALFAAFCVDDPRTEETIKTCFWATYRLIDPHTAVALAARRASGFENAVVVSTASPYKFPRAVYRAIAGRDETDAFLCLDRLEALSGLPVPKALAELKTLPLLHTKECAAADIVPAAEAMIESLL